MKPLAQLQQNIFYTKVSDHFYYLKSRTTTECFPKDDNPICKPSKGSPKKCPKPLAIFGYVDGHALTILDIVLELGYRIPEDIAILGVDNNDLACEGVDVPISSVESDQEGLGEKSAQLLAQRMSGTPIKPNIIRHPIKGVITRKSSDTLASSHPKIQQALAIILSQFQTGINALELAKRMDMTPQGLQHIFKEHDGRSPGEVLRMVRLQHAKELLLDHDYKLQDISTRCGYASVDAFCRVFRQNLHCTPTHWRKNQEN
jgi:LacI family transcriptional regulator